MIASPALIGIGKISLVISVWEKQAFVQLSLIFQILPANPEGLYGQIC
jgi:hypothetical protein